MFTSCLLFIERRNGGREGGKKGGRKEGMKEGRKEVYSTSTAWRRNTSHTKIRHCCMQHGTCKHTNNNPFQIAAYVCVCVCGYCYFYPCAHRATGDVCTRNLKIKNCAQLYIKARFTALTSLLQS